MFIDKPRENDVKAKPDNTGRSTTVIFAPSSSSSYAVVRDLWRSKEKNVQIFLDSENRVHPTRPAVLGRKKTNYFVLRPARN